MTKQERNTDRLFDFTHTENDEEFMPLMDLLNCNFLKYKREIRAYFQSSFNREGGKKIHYSQKIPKDNINELIDKLIPFIDNPTNVEAFHKLMVYSLGDYIRSDVNPLGDEGEENRTADFLKDRLHNSSKEDTFFHLLDRVADYYQIVIERMTTQLIHLYDEKSRLNLNRLKKIVFILGSTKLTENQSNTKMSLDEQIKLIEDERQKAIELYKLLKIEKKPTGCNTLSFTQERHSKSTSYIEGYFQNLLDVKDYAISQIEESIVEYMKYKILSTEKNHKIEYLLGYMRNQPELLFAKDFSFSIRRYFTDLLVEGTKFVPQKTSELQDTRNDDKKVFLSFNFLGNLIEKAHALDIQSYRSNSFFDNVSISTLSLNTIYHSFSDKWPQMILILKNLEGRFLDEVDVFEDLLYNNPYENKISAISEILKDFTLTISAGFLKPKKTLELDISSRQIMYEKMFEMALDRYSISEEEIFTLLNLIDSYFNKAFMNQSKLLTFVDYDDRARLMENGGFSMKFTNDKNQNKDILESATQLTRSRSVGIVNVAEKYGDIKLTRQEDLRELKELKINPIFGTITDNLQSNNAKLVQEKLESYIFTKLEKLQVDENFDHFKSIVYLEKSYFKLITLGSRTNMCRLSSYLNYFAAIELRVRKRQQTYKDALKDFNTLNNIKPKIPEKKEAKKIRQKDWKDDSFVLDKTVLLQAENEDVIRSKRRASISHTPEMDELLKQIIPGDMIEEEPEIIKSSENEGPPSSSRMRSNMLIPNMNTNILQQAVNSSKDLSDSQRSTMRQGIESESSRRSKDSPNGIQISEFVDQIKFESISESLICCKADKNFLVTVTDAKNSAIIYDTALEDFKKIEFMMKQLLSYFVENNLIDYCFAAVSVEDQIADIQGEIHEANKAHLKLDVSIDSKQLSLEYLIYKIYLCEADYQSQKVRLIEKLFSIFPHIGRASDVDKLAETISRIIKKRPPMDLNRFDMLNDNIAELCNSKVSLSDINIKSIAQEIQNYIITIFDGYQIGTAYFERYLSLVERIIKDSVGDGHAADWIHERKNISHLFKGTPNLHFEFHSNFDLLCSFDEVFNSASEHLNTNLIDLSSIDQLTYTDSLIENNTKRYFKSMTVKYLYDNRKQAANTVYGKGIKESTSLYFVRLYLANLLEKRTQFVRGNVELVMLDDIFKEWSNIGEGFSQWIINQESELMVNEVVTRESYISNVSSGILHIHAALQSEKKNKILKARFDYWETIRNKSSYGKAEFEDKIRNINMLFVSSFFLEKQIDIRKTLDSFEFLGRLDFAQQDCYKVNSRQGLQKNLNNRHQAFISLKEILSSGDRLTIKLSMIQKLLKLPIAEVWESEKITKNIAFIADAKASYEFLIMSEALYRSTLYSNNLCITLMTQEACHYISNLFTLEPVVDRVITNVDVLFKKNIQKENSIGSLTYNEDLYLTNASHLASTEILFSSRNESITRRLVFQSLFENASKLLVEPNVLLDRLKERTLGSKGDQSTNRLNFVKGGKTKTPRFRNGANAEHKSKPPLELYKLTNSQGLTELLIAIQRVNLLMSKRLDVLFYQKNVNDSMRNICGWLKPIRSNVPTYYRMKKLNLSFWKALSDCNVEYQANNLFDVKKSMDESLDDIKDKDKTNKRRFISSFPLFYDYNPNENGMSPYELEDCGDQLSSFKNLEELAGDFMRDISLVLDYEKNVSESRLFPNLNICSLKMPNSLFESKNDSELKKTTSLGKLIGHTKANRVNINQGQQSKFDSQKYDDISAYAKNFYNNSLDLILEKLLVNSGILPPKKHQVEEDERVEINIREIFRSVEYLKFRTNLKEAIFDQDKREVLERNEAEKEGSGLTEMIKNTSTSKYQKKLCFLSQFIMLYILKQRLVDPDPGSGSSLPTWILKHFDSDEFALVYKGDSNQDNKEDSVKNRMLTLKQFSIVFIDFKRLKELYDESDHGDKDSRLRIENDLSAYMKSKNLYSIFYSRTYLNNPLRNFDLRLKVHLYELQCYEKNMSSATNDIVEFLEDLKVNSEDEYLEILQEKSCILQTECILSLYDVISRLKWSISKGDQSLIPSLLSFDSLLRIFKKIREDISNKHENFLGEGYMQIRNIDLEGFLKERYTQEITVLRHLKSSYFQQKNSHPYVYSFDYLEKERITDRFIEWSKKAEWKDRALLLAKINESHRMWQYHGSKKVESIFGFAEVSQEHDNIIDIDLLSNDPSSKLVILKKRNLFLKLQTKCFELLHYISHQHAKSSGHGLTVTREELKKMEERINFRFEAPLENAVSSACPNALSYQFRELLSEMVIQQVIVKKRNEEIYNAVQTYKQRTKKNFNQKIKHEAFDHFYHLELNYTQIENFLAEEENDLNDLLHIDDDDYLMEDLQHEHKRYIDEMMRGTFITKNLEIILSCTGYLIKKAIKVMLREKSEILGLSAIYFSRINEHLNHKILQKKLSRRRLVGSKRVIDQIAPKISIVSKEQILLIDSALEAQKAEYLPFLWSFFERLVHQSCSISTKNNRHFYMINKSDFVHSMSSFLRSCGLYFQDLDRSIGSVFGNIIKRSRNYVESKKYQLNRTMEEFSFFMDNFHKLVEGKLSDDNFKAIYSIDKVAQSIKDIHYYNSVDYERLREQVMKEYEEPLMKLYMRYRTLKNKYESYEKCLSLDIREFIAETHNNNMIEIRSKLCDILGEKVDIIDSEIGVIVEDAEIMELLDGERLIKLATFMNSNRLRYSNMLNLLISKNDQINQVISEKISVGDTLFKKIKEIIRREAILQGELHSATTDIEQLEYQNSILEKDIHTCNFERVNLTRTIADQSSQLLKLEDMIKQRAELQVQQKASFLKAVRAVSKIDTNSPKTTERAKAMREILEDNQLIRLQEGTSSKPKIASKKKKGGYVFKNGRLEKKFRIK